MRAEFRRQRDQHAETHRGPVDPLFQALSGRLTFTVRRHKCNKYFLLGHFGQMMADRTFQQKLADERAVVVTFPDHRRTNLRVFHLS